MSDKSDQCKTENCWLFNYWNSRMVAGYSRVVVGCHLRDSGMIAEWKRRGWLEIAEISLGRHSSYVMQQIWTHNLLRSKCCFERQSSNWVVADCHAGITVTVRDGGGRSRR